MAGTGHTASSGQTPTSDPLHATVSATAAADPAAVPHGARRSSAGADYGVDHVLRHRHSLRTAEEDHRVGCLAGMRPQIRTGAPAFAHRRHGRHGAGPKRTGIRKHSGRPRIPESFLSGARKRAPPTPCAEPAAQGKTRSVRKNAASAATRQVIEIRHVAPAGRGPMRFFDRSASAILADRRKKDREKTMPTFAESPIFCYLCFLKQNDLWQTRNSR